MLIDATHFSHKGGNGVSAKIRNSYFQFPETFHVSQIVEV